MPYVHSSTYNVYETPFILYEILFILLTLLNSVYYRFLICLFFSRMDRWGNPKKILLCQVVGVCESSFLLLPFPGFSLRWSSLRVSLPLTSVYHRQCSADLGCFSENLPSSSSLNMSVCNHIEDGGENHPIWIRTDNSSKYHVLSDNVSAGNWFWRVVDGSTPQYGESSTAFPPQVNDI